MENRKPMKIYMVINALSIFIHIVLIPMLLFLFVMGTHAMNKAEALKVGLIIGLIGGTMGNVPNIIYYIRNRVQQKADKWFFVFAGIVYLVYVATFIIFINSPSGWEL